MALSSWMDHEPQNALRGLHTPLSLACLALSPRQQSLRTPTRLLAMVQSAHVHMALGFYRGLGKQLVPPTAPWTLVVLWTTVVCGGSRRSNQKEPLLISRPQQSQVAGSGAKSASAEALGCCKLSQQFALFSSCPGWLLSAGVWGAISIHSF